MIFKNKNGLEVRSAGTEKAARIRISSQLMEWADIIFVMENKHKKRISVMFPEIIDDKKVIVLDIPDEYNYMDEELIAFLEDSVPFYLQS